MDGGGTMSMPTTTTTMTAGGGLNTMSSVSKGPRPPVTVAGLRLDLPLDDEDYLMPSPQSPMQFNNNPAPGGGHGNPYMDLISETTPKPTTPGGGAIPDRGAIVEPTGPNRRVPDRVGSGAPGQRAV